MQTQFSIRSRTALSLVVAGVLAAAAVPVVAAQEDGAPEQERTLGPPESPRNLQILPADMSTRAVFGVMRGFSGALGVRCIHCHVGDDPNDLSTVDFISDDKETKRIARAMMQMVGEINDGLQPALASAGRADGMEVRCATCHRGNSRPVRLQDVLAERHASDGVDGALELYEELYARHYGSALYDFTEGSLIRTANQLARAGDLEAGQALIDRNLERYPESTRTYFTWGQTLAAAGEIDRARASFEGCLKVNPEASWCQNAIDELGEAEQ